LSKKRLPILNLGDFAANILLPDSEGSVLASFSKVTYLRHALDEVIWFVSEDAPMHRRAIQLPGSLPGFLVDTPYIVKNKVLMLESGYALDFNFAKKWKTPYLFPDHALPIKEIKEYLGQFLSACEGFPSPNGLGLFIPAILNLNQDQANNNTPDRLDLTASQRFAWPTIKHIARACLTRDIDGIFKHGEEMIGLGEGLTPSGDDFIGGLLFCIRKLQDLYKLYHPSVFSKLEEFLERLKSRTNLISYTMLKDHANGYASETLHTFIYELLSGHDRVHLRYLGSELIQIGHSTGWDILAGVMTGMLSISDLNTQNQFQHHRLTSQYP
jgi:hypothetical protein